MIDTQELNLKDVASKPKLKESEIKRLRDLADKQSIESLVVFFDKYLEENPIPLSDETHDAKEKTKLSYREVMLVFEFVLNNPISFFYLGQPVFANNPLLLEAFETGFLWGNNNIEHEDEPHELAFALGKNAMEAVRQISNKLAQLMHAQDLDDSLVHDVARRTFSTFVQWANESRASLPVVSTVPVNGNNSDGADAVNGTGAENGAGTGTESIDWFGLPLQPDAKERHQKITMKQLEEMNSKEVVLGFESALMEEVQALESDLRLRIRHIQGIHENDEKKKTLFLEVMRQVLLISPKSPFRMTMAVFFNSSGVGTDISASNYRDAFRDGLLASRRNYNKEELMAYTGGRIAMSIINRLFSQILNIISKGQDNKISMIGVVGDEKLEELWQEATEVRNTCDNPKYAVAPEYAPAVVGSKRRQDKLSQNEISRTIRSLVYAIENRLDSMALDQEYLFDFVFETLLTDERSPFNYTVISKKSPVYVHGFWAYLQRGTAISSKSDLMLDDKATAYDISIARSVFNSGISFAQEAVKIWRELVQEFANRHGINDALKNLSDIQFLNEINTRARQYNER